MNSGQSRLGGGIDAEILAGLVALATPVSLLAQDVSPGESAQGDLFITIFNNDVALVQDVRTLDLANGRVQQNFPDVSAQIRPETVSLAVPGAAIVEQNFDYDLLSPSRGCGDSA
jgi:hypothetical protein